jgi:dTDP-4-amino-4,6-dideoxygalactose transaminase
MAPHPLPRIYLSAPHMGGTEQAYVDLAFRENWIAPLGPNVDGFEEDLCKYTGSAHAAALTSGTAALHLALILAEVGQGDEVLVSTFTFSASVNPIIYQGAVPILIESEADTWNMSPDFLEEAIKDRIAKGKKPKAIVLVHLYGNAGQMDRLVEIASKYEITLIEDAAEALGSSYQGKALGTFGKLGVLSFNGNKIITTSGGGALLSAHQELIQKARFLATQARDPAPHYEHSHIGYNYRMSNISAGIGRGQMEALDKHIARRKEWHKRYTSFFKENTTLAVLQEPQGTVSNHWLTCIFEKASQSNTFNREGLRLHLEAQNIESRPLWKPMHLQPVFMQHPYYGNRLSDALFQSGLCLPSGSGMSESDFLRIENALAEYFRIR